MTNLSESFIYNFGNVINSPLQTKLKQLNEAFLSDLKNSNQYYTLLIPEVTGILLDENSPPSLDDVNLLNIDLAAILMALEDGTLNFGQLGGVAFGLNQTDFEFDPFTGYLKSMPISSIVELIKWVQSSIQNATNLRYKNSVIYLNKLMNSLNKADIERMLVIIDSLTENNELPCVTISSIVENLATVGLSFTEDPLISKIDPTIPDLFVQKHMVTTKIYGAIEKKIMFIGGYDPMTLNFHLTSLTPSL